MTEQSIKYDYDEALRIISKTFAILSMDNQEPHEANRHARNLLSEFLENLS